MDLRQRKITRSHESIHCLKSTTITPVIMISVLLNIVSYLFVAIIYEVDTSWFLLHSFLTADQLLNFK